jgi:L,D-transpeptidase-like protein
MKLLILLAGGAVLVIALAAGVFLALRDDDESRAPKTAKPRVIETVLPAEGEGQYFAARVLPGSQVALRDRPEGKLLGGIGDRTSFGSPETLAVVSTKQPRWVEVRHTALGNAHVAWLDAGAPGVRLLRRSLLLEVDLSRRELLVRSADRIEQRMPVAVGAPDTPTPTGEFYVTDKLPGRQFGPYYGCCILALSGHQPNLPQGWSGGDRLAIHGSPTPTWGLAVSNGCFHAAPANLRYLMKTVPLGTRVVVHA